MRQVEASSRIDVGGVDLCGIHFASKQRPQGNSAESQAAGLQKRPSVGQWKVLLRSRMIVSDRLCLNVRRLSSLTSSARRQC